MAVRVLYFFPGLVPPPMDPAFADMAHVAGDIRIDVLLPIWHKQPEEVEAALGRGAFPTYRLAGKLTYHLFLAGKYPLGSFRQKFAILWFYIVQGLLLACRERFDCFMAYNWGIAGLAAFVLSRVLGKKLIVSIANVPENAYRFNQFGQSWHHSAKTSFKTRFAIWASNRMLRMIGGSADRLHLLYPEQVKCYPALQRVPSSVLPVYTALARVPCTGATEKSVLLVGAPWYVKGADLLIAAFRKIEAEFPDWKLRLMGYFPDRQRLEEMIGDSRRIEILKARPNPETLQVIAGCSVLVLPSRTEAAGRVLVEAMAAGKPLIGSRVGGVPLYVQDGINGLLFENGNVEDLTQKLQIMLSSPDLRERMGHAGYNMAQTQYTAEVWGRMMQEMIESTISGPIPATALRREALQNVSHQAPALRVPRTPAVLSRS